MRLGQSVYARDRANRRAKIPEWTTAAESGDVDAQLKLAWEYARGDAIDADIAKAWSLFDRAAASGREEALVNRARFLQLRCAPTGMLELRKLAAKGNWKAQLWIAQYYQAHRDRMSRLRAVAWYNRSLKNGGGVAAELGKLGQLTRIAPTWSKAFFIAKAIFKSLPLVLHITRQPELVEFYESLDYRLKDKSS